MNTVLTVSQVNMYIKSILTENINLKSILIRGEISNFSNNYKSGHMYFSLKDEKSLIKAVMFSSYAMKLKFRPEDGMKVIVSGQITVYEPSGQYQVLVHDMQPDGIGALSLAYEQLKRKLEEEGLFSVAEREIPRYPKVIGVITSPTGAAVQDILQIISRRWPVAKIQFCPSSVQGNTAPRELIEALKVINSKHEADVIIIGRGGGSIEDLWAFNDEKLASAVASSEIPVISAVGHETDYTICDFAADLRAPTPSAAAELSTPDIYEEITRVKALDKRLYDNICEGLRSKSQKLDSLISNEYLKDPFFILKDRIKRLTDCNIKMYAFMIKKIGNERSKLGELSGKLDGMSPLKVLSRGYAIPSKKGKIVKSISDIKKDDLISLRMIDGVADLNVLGISERDGVK
jgi:exodeoxyribonuclease VII large subunit